MYAVVTTGGKQYRVEAGSELMIERLTADAGSSITFDRVLLVGDGETVTVGTPTVDGATVSGTVLGEALGPKLVIFKFKQKVKYRRRTGHRQHLTRVRIDDISLAGSERRNERRQEPPAEVSAPAEASAPAEVSAPAEASAPAEVSAPADSAEKPKRARRSAAAAAEETNEAAEKPKRTRRATAPKAESEE